MNAHSLSYARVIKIRKKCRCYRPMESKFKAVSKLWMIAQMKSIYAELLFLTTAFICLPLILSDFWLKNLFFLIFFISLFLLTISEHFHDGIHPFSLGELHCKMLHMP